MCKEAAFIADLSCAYTEVDKVTYEGVRSIPAGSFDAAACGTGDSTEDADGNIDKRELNTVFPMMLAPFFAPTATCQQST
jgi:hypothetical protein